MRGAVGETSLIGVESAGSSFELWFRDLHQRLLDLVMFNSATSDWPGLQTFSFC